MTYIVNDKCIKCKLMDCVEVCPVDCFYEGKNMLVIKPDECIDCGVCEPECPVEAIISDTEDESGKWLEVNKKYSELWPNITDKKEPPSNNSNSPENIEYLDSFFDDKHMRESTYERMSKREPMVQTGTNPYLQNSYIDGITIRDKYLMPYHESKPRTKKDELEA